MTTRQFFALQRGAVGVKEFEIDEPVPESVIDPCDEHVAPLFERRLKGRFRFFGNGAVEFAKEKGSAVEVDAFDDMRFTPDAELERRRLLAWTLDEPYDIDAGVGAVHDVIGNVDPVVGFQREGREGPRSISWERVVHRRTCKGGRVDLRHRRVVDGGNRLFFWKILQTGEGRSQRRGV